MEEIVEKPKKKKGKKKKKHDKSSSSVSGVSSAILDIRLHVVVLPFWCHSLLNFGNLTESLFLFFSLLLPLVTPKIPNQLNQKALKGTMNALCTRVKTKMIGIM